MLTEQRVLEDNLLQQLNELLGQVSTHECLHRTRHVLRILCLTESRLDHLIDQWAAEGVILNQDTPPQLSVTATDEIASLGLEQRVLVANLSREW